MKIRTFDLSSATQLRYASLFVFKGKSYYASTTEMAFYDVIFLRLGVIRESMVFPTSQKFSKKIKEIDFDQVTSWRELAVNRYTSTPTLKDHYNFINKFVESLGGLIA